MPKTRTSQPGMQVTVPFEDILAEVGAPFPRRDCRFNGCAVRVDAECSQAAENDRADIAGFMGVSMYGADHGIFQLFFGKRDFDAVDFRRVPEAPDVFVEKEEC